MRCSEIHKTLKDGKGKCSVPMWCNGVPAGFCDKPAFGKPVKCDMYRDRNGRLIRSDGKYEGYVPGLACVGHGGPPCPGIDLGDGNFSGCDQSGGDCLVCGR